MIHLNSVFWEVSCMYCGKAGVVHVSLRIPFLTKQFNNKIITPSFGAIVAFV